MPKNHTELIKVCTLKIKRKRVADKEGKYFDTERNILQENSLSSLLFIVTLENVFRKLGWENRNDKRHPSQSPTFRGRTCIGNGKYKQI